MAYGEGLITCIRIIVLIELWKMKRGVIALYILCVALAATIRVWFGVVPDVFDVIGVMAVLVLALFSKKPLRTLDH
jgi:hypothetical protein